MRRVNVAANTEEAGFHGQQDIYLPIDQRSLRILKLDSAGAAKNVNVFAPDGLVARKEGQTWTYYTFDAQGNVLNKLDASQNVTAGRLLDAWGQGVETTLPRNIDPWGYNATPPPSPLPIEDGEGESPPHLQPLPARAEMGLSMPVPRSVEFGESGALGSS